MFDTKTWRDKTPKQRLNERKDKIKRSLAEGPKSYTELYEALAKHTEETVGMKKVEHAGWSKRDLTRCLRDLESDFIIAKVKMKKKGKKGEKKTKYVLTEKVFGIDYERFHKSHEMNKFEETMVRDIIKEMRESKKKLVKKEATRLINAVIWRGLLDYLVGVETVALTTKKFKSYARWLLERQINRFSRLIVELGRKHPKEMEKVFQKIHESFKRSN